MGTLLSWLFRKAAIFALIALALYVISDATTVVKCAAVDENDYCLSDFAVRKQEELIKKAFSGILCTRGPFNTCRAEYKIAFAKLQRLRERKASSEQRLIAAGHSIPDCHLQSEYFQDCVVAQKISDRVSNSAKAAIPYWLAIILLPFLGRAVLFYLLAPIAAKSSFVKFRIGRSAKATTTLPLQDFSGPGGATLRMTLAPGDELLVHGNFVRSVPDSVVCSSEWVYSSNLILRSLSSELIAMDSYKPKKGSPADITLGAGDCVTDELATVELAEGEAMVIAPRSIAGIVQRTGTRARITSHWRLRRLSSWLLMRLRLLAVHGPCTVLMTSNRGVTAVRPGTGTTFDGKCLVGFRGPMEYTVRRTGSFWGNFSGKQSMFHMNMRSRGNGVVYMQNQPSSTAIGAQQNLAQRMLDFFLSLIGF